MDVLYSQDLPLLIKLIWCYNSLGLHHKRTLNHWKVRMRPRCCNKYPSLNIVLCVKCFQRRQKMRLILWRACFNLILRSVLPLNKHWNILMFRCSAKKRQRSVPQYFKYQFLTTQDSVFKSTRVSFIARFRVIKARNELRFCLIVFYHLLCMRSNC